MKYCPKIQYICVDVSLCISIYNLLALTHKFDQILRVRAIDFTFMVAAVAFSHLLLLYFLTLHLHHLNNRAKWHTYFILVSVNIPCIFLAKHFCQSVSMCHIAIWVGWMIGCSCCCCYTLVRIALQTNQYFRERNKSIGEQTTRICVALQATFKLLKRTSRRRVQEKKNTEQRKTSATLSIYMKQT